MQSTLAWSGRDRFVKFLIAANVVLLSLVGLLVLTGFEGRGRAGFTEIDVERVNVVDANGRPIIVLSNRSRIPGPKMNGKEYPRSVAEGRDLLSGMIFYNDQGDEVGGLLFNGIVKGSSPSDYGAIGHLSFDQWKQNQVLALQYNDHGNTRSAGLTVWDRPTDVSLDKQLDMLARMQDATPEQRQALRQALADAKARGDDGVQRVFVGSKDRTAVVQLSDSHGRTRIRLYVDDAENPRMEFLDEKGQVAAVFPGPK